jgi:hypothetical protein
MDDTGAGSKVAREQGKGAREQRALLRKVAAARAPSYATPAHGGIVRQLR